ncbi:MAG: Gfo/Idh/MocA family oxidoreductase [Acidobacteriaceae bacterium]|nr:Gfo/Idh/MocA family oxidoreductase [Acidobacteriaceae bacterium]
MSDEKIRVAVIGAGSFGRNHVRILSHMAGVELAAIVDSDHERARKLAQEHGSQAYAAVEQMPAAIQAAVVATPTVTHEAIAERLLETGVDVLVEKPIAATSASGERLAELAAAKGRILQAGHLERFNPAVMALEKALTIPLFFEVHRLSVFTPRSLDVDVILDLMIHDLDIVLSFTRELPNEVRAAGISVLSPKVDIANVRLAFPSGCIANLTASRVSTERVRKLRLFQPGEYISIDYQRQEAVRLAVLRNELPPEQPPPGFVPSKTSDKSGNGFAFSNPGIAVAQLAVEHGEPLQLELASFIQCVRERMQPRVDGYQAANALRVAESVVAKMKEHGDLVTETVRRRGEKTA